MCLLGWPPSKIYTSITTSGAQRGESYWCKQVHLLRLPGAWLTLGQTAKCHPCSNHNCSTDPKVLHGMSEHSNYQLSTISGQWGQLFEGPNCTYLRCNTSQSSWVLSVWGRGRWRWWWWSTCKLWREPWLWRHSCNRNGRVTVHMGASRSAHPNSGNFHFHADYAQDCN